MWPLDQTARVVTVLQAGSALVIDLPQQQPTRISAFFIATGGRLKCSSVPYGCEAASNKRMDEEAQE